MFGRTTSNHIPCYMGTAMAGHYSPSQMLLLTLNAILPLSICCGHRHDVKSLTNNRIPDRLAPHWWLAANLMTQYYLTN